LHFYGKQRKTWRGSTWCWDQKESILPSRLDMRVLGPARKWVMVPQPRPMNSSSLSHQFCKADFHFHSWAGNKLCLLKSGFPNFKVGYLLSVLLTKNKCILFWRRLFLTFSNL
jgi:hypothetical protein